MAVLRDEEAHSDVVREAQELVELALKGMLRVDGERAYDEAAWIADLAARAIGEGGARGPQ